MAGVRIGSTRYCVSRRLIPTLLNALSGTRKLSVCFRRAIFLTIFAWCGASSAATTIEDLQPTFSTIERALRAPEQGPYPLDQEISELSRALDGKEISEGKQWIVYYYRGFAYVVKGLWQQSAGDPSAKDAYRKALGDLEAAIETYASTPEAVADSPALQLAIANAAYLAGITSIELGDKTKAYEYYRRCAAQNHAACLNIVAHAMITGDGGTPIDLDGAIALFKIVSDRGTDFGCAGSFSALAIARILHFRGGPPATVKDLEWIERAHTLRTSLERKLNKSALCEAGVVFVSDYLIRLSRGEERQELLVWASERAINELWHYLIAYLKGERDDAAFRERAREVSNKHQGGACTMYFYAWWHARARGQTERMREYFDLLFTLDTKSCRDTLALARLGARDR